MIYLSHRITGNTPEEMKQNCQDAIRFAEGLRYHFPDVQFYVPAEFEPFVAKAYAKNKLSVEDILEIDCDIIKKDCTAAIFYIPTFVSSGMRVEHNYCILKDIAWIQVKDLAIEDLTRFLKAVGEL